MAETLLWRCPIRYTLCRACEHAYHADLDLPPSGPENIILRTGRIPSSAEAEHVRQSIAQLDECLEEIDDEVDDLEALIAQLRDGQRALKGLRRVQRAYLAPVRKLPPEILSIVFKMCYGDESIDLSRERCEPIILSAVCKTWRDTMAGLHSAWTAFEFGPACEVEHSIVLARLRTFLNNSGNLPLRHCIRFEMTYATVLDLQKLQLLDLLIEHSHRWTDATFRSFGETQQEIVAMLANRPLTRLTKLEGDVDLLAACNAIGIFRGASTLRSVTLWGMCYHKTIPDLPWEHIEELSTKTPGAYALAFIHRCPNLVRWSYRDGSKYERGQPPASPTVLPRLRFLSVHIEEEADAIVLASITAPALLECRLVCKAKGFSTNMDLGFATFLTRSACRLERLFLDRPPHNVLDHLYTDALQGLTTLRVVAHKEAPVTKAFIEGLSGSTPDPCLLPQLENLELGGEPAEILGDALVEMAKARRRMGRPLKRLFFDAGPLGLSARAFGWNAGVEKRMKEVVDCVETSEHEICAALAGLTLLWYDTLCTIFEEVELVWRGRWGAGNYLYFYVRYAPFVTSIVSFRTMFWTNTAAQCKLYNQIYTVLACATFNVCEAILLLRTYALYGATRTMLVTCLLIFGLTVLPGTIIDMWQLSKLQLYDGGEPRKGCVGTSSPILGIAYLLLTVCELAIVILTGFKAVQHPFPKSVSCAPDEKRGSFSYIDKVRGPLVCQANSLEPTTAVSIIQNLSILMIPAHANWLSLQVHDLHAVFCSRLLLLIFAQKREATQYSDRSATSAPILTTQALTFYDSEADFEPDRIDLDVYRTRSSRRWASDQ
ncbi:uncharacterized protein SCHCODRAFT_01175766 [Schizophyllum commune H4-8]|nr:uncharacterized protein SCHCODRAFT_01175766 [Schizophyllum commune H4-8]KAI5885916.1 hypothetical protein SCHCODRAFT_01175766 [Schizophyllum commune H4-8]